MIHRRFLTFSLGAAVACAAAAGCSGGGSGSQQSQGQTGGFFGLFARKDPNADLTAEEGQKLLADIRKDPKRMQKLTPGEKRYLAKATADTNGDS